MQIERYGIVLERLTLAHLDLVREWRNAAHVRGQMEYQSVISSQQHLAWFESVNNTDNLYFMIQYRNQYIGVVNAKDIDFESGSAEAGIFIGDEDYLNDPASMLAVFALMDFLFEVLGLQTLKAKISSTNEKAISFNQKLGYQLLPNQEKQDFTYWKATKTSYFDTAESLRKGSAKLFGGEGWVILTPDSHFAKLLKDRTPGNWTITS